MRAFTASEWDYMVTVSRASGLLPKGMDRGELLEFASHNLRENFTSADEVMAPGRDILEALVSTEGSTEAVVKAAFNKIRQAGVSKPEDVKKAAGNIDEIAKVMKDAPQAGKTVVKKDVSENLMDKIKGLIKGGDLGGGIEDAVKADIRKALFKAFPMTASQDRLSGLALTPYRSTVGESLLIADMAPNYAFKASIVDIQPGQIVVLDRTNMCLREFKP